jgi:hypothetical protein
MIDRETLSRVTLFADLAGPQLEELAHTLDDERFPSGGIGARSRRSSASSILRVNLP